MSDKDRIDDFASLFLPDILNPLANMDGQVKLEDDPSFSRNNNSNHSTPSSSGLSAFRFLSNDQPAQSQGRMHNDMDSWQFSPPMAGQPMNQPMMPNTGYYSSHMGFPDYNQLRHSPFPGSDMGHMSHYADLFPTEALLQAPMRQQQFSQMPQMMPQKMAAQQDGYARGPLMMGHSYHQAPGSAPVPRSNTESPGFSAQPPKKREVKSSSETPSTKVQSHMRAPEEFKVEYATDSLIRLLDLKSDFSAEKPRVLDHAGRPVSIRLMGFLRGKFLTSDYDNYNYLVGTQGSVNLDQTHQPQVIAYFRRNFINIYLKICINNPGSGFSINGEPVLRFRVIVRAFTDGPERKKVSVITKHQDADPKDFQKMGDKLPIETINANHVIPLPDCKNDMYFNVKKLQFKTATSNSTNIGIQTYNKLYVLLIADLPSGECVLDRLTTPPIIVRGRNPSFYYSRHDTLIETRLPQYNNSYDHSASAETEEHVPLKDDTPVPPSEFPTDINQNAMITFKDDEETLTSRASGDTRPTEDTNTADQDEESNDEESFSPDVKEKPDAVTVPSGTNLGKFLNSVKTESSDNYHYFPISNVYYLPPINVVYFPHGAHHEDASREGQQADSKSQVGSQMSPPTGSERKGEKSKVYFK